MSGGHQVVERMAIVEVACKTHTLSSRIAGVLKQADSSYFRCYVCFQSGSGSTNQTATQPTYVICLPGSSGVKGYNPHKVGYASEQS